MNRFVVFGIAIFFAVLGIAMLGGDNLAVAGHGCAGCYGPVACDGYVACGGPVVVAAPCYGVPAPCCGPILRHRMHGLWRCGGVVACDCGGVVVCGGPVQKGVVYGGPVQKEGPVQKVGPVQKDGAAQKGEAAQKSARVIILDHSPVAYRQVSFRR